MIDGDEAWQFFLDCLEHDYRSSGNREALYVFLGRCRRHHLEIPAWARTEKVALDWATECFRKSAEDLSASGSRKFADDPIKLLRYADNKADAFNVMFEAAKRGDWRAMAGVSAVAGALLKLGQKLPEPLLDFVYNLLRGKIKAKRKRGPDKFVLIMRDVIIAGMVKDIADTMGFSPTRNDATEAPSAASIVREALKVGAKIHLTESAINQIYGRHKR